MSVSGERFRESVINSFILDYFSPKSNEGSNNPIEVNISDLCRCDLSKELTTLEVADVAVESWDNHFGAKIQELAQRWEEIDAQFLTQETLNHFQKQNRAPASVLVPFQLDYKDLGNERNCNLVHPFLTMPAYSDDDDNSIAHEGEDSTEKETHMEYMQRLLSILREVPSAERPCKIVAARNLPHNTIPHDKHMGAYLSSLDEESVTAAVNDIDTVITFSIHSPFDDVQRQSIEVLGSQTLTNLQDAIYCVQDYVDKEAGNASSFMFINGDFYIKTPLHENGRGEDPVHYKSYVNENIQPIIEWLRSPLCSSSSSAAAAASSDTNLEKDSRIISNAKRSANVSVSDGIRVPCSASRSIEQNIDSSSRIQTAGSSSDRGVVTSSSSSSSNITARPVVGKKRGGLSCFADQARLVLRKAEEDDAKKGKGPQRRVSLPDSSRNQALVEALLTQLGQRTKIRYQDIERQWLKNTSSCDFTPQELSTASASSSSSSSASAAPEREDEAAKNYSPRIASMRDVRCGELILQMGARYLYCHQGCCEHFLYVTDIRLRHPLADAAATTDSFPAVKFMKSVKRRRCCVCDALMAKFVVYGDRLLEQSPAFLCQQCYFMLHYSADGKLLYDDFTVFPYLHDA